MKKHPVFKRKKAIIMIASKECLARQRSFRSSKVLKRRLYDMINMIQIKMGLVRLSQSKERLRQTKTFNQVTDSTNCCQSPKSRSSEPQFLSYPRFRNLNMSAKFRGNCTYTCTSDKQFVRSFVADMFSFWYIFLGSYEFGQKG